MRRLGLPPSPEVLASDVSLALSETMDKLQLVQGHLFADLGYRPQDRMGMAETLAQSFHRSGLIGLPARKLRRYVPIALLSDLLWSFFCNAPIGLLQRRLIQYFYQQPDFSYYAKQRFMSEMPQRIGSA